MPTWSSCPQNTKNWRQAGTPTSFSPTITADVTEPAIAHINDLRTAINAERQRRNKGAANAYSFEDTLQGDVTEIRKKHIDDLRAAVADTNAMTCPSDNAVTPSWTDDPIVADVIEIRKPHIDEVRTGVNSLEGACICNCEFCNYCADCGNQAGCGCDDHQGSECSYGCSARNSGPTYENPPTAWCVHDYGNNWGNGAWGCMCTPDSGPCGTVATMRMFYNKEKYGRG